MGSINRNLLGQIGSYGSWLIVQKSVGFLLLPLYTHYLTPLDYGVLALLDLIATYFGIVVNSGYSSALMRFYNQYDRERWHRIVYSSCLAAVLCIGILFMALAGLIVPWLISVTHAEHIATDLVLYILLTTFLTTLNGISSVLLRVQEKVGLFIKIGIVTLAISVFLNVLLIAGLGYGVYGFVISGLITAIISVFIYAYYILLGFYANPSKKLIIQMSKFSYPFIFSGLVNSFTHNVGIICLTIFGNLSLVGIYAVGQKIGSVVSIIGSSIVTAWTPYMFKISKEKDSTNTYAEGTLFIITFMLYICLGVTVLSKPIIHALTDSAFHSAVIVILPVSIGLSLFVLTPTLRMGMLLKNKTLLVPLISIVAVAIGFPFALFLTQAYGMVGAAWGFTSIWALSNLFTVIVSRKQLHVPYDYKKIGVVVACFIISFMFFFLMQEQYLVSLLAIVIYPILLVISGIFKSEIMQLRLYLQK